MASLPARRIRRLSCYCWAGESSGVNSTKAVERTLQAMTQTLSEAIYLKSGREYQEQTTDFLMAKVGSNGHVELTTPDFDLVLLPVPPLGLK
jgi:hypothetical protein